MTGQILNELIICATHPYFLEKDDFWFEKNEKKIIQASKIRPFFQENTCYITLGIYMHLSKFLRKLDELGYEKVMSIAEPGEFSRRGGTIDIFPINLNFAVRIEFYGNVVESIKPLPIQIKEGKLSRQRLLKKIKRQETFSGIKKLKPGDYVVHLDHGIGKFIGKVKLSNISPGKPTTYYIIEYSKGDKLYVPENLERKLSLYIGFAEPKISRLSSPTWERTKRKAKEDAQKLAKQLLELYAKREITVRPPIQGDLTLLKEVTASFPYQETPDQIQAIEEIIRDLNKPRPIDILICGDVGFGKTEIALRVAVYYASANSQVALICPTTILANQHYRTFKERLKKLPFNVALLSRLQSKTEQKQIIKALASGSIDIVIGTHRLLSSDVGFKNLGLLIVDDEHRFGVKQKEKLKEARSSLDIISLSATPIPRTLYLALSSLKKIIVIQTPPPGRLPINTFVLPWNEKTIKKAIIKELNRAGQVYYLHNRIETINLAKNTIEKLVPQARISIIHGRMAEKELISALEEFRTKKTNILIATTIIENGLDLPDVNTLIVADATKLGLAQAYQIRGRIGRSHQQAEAYFLYNQNLPDKAKQRLKILVENKELGSGYRIAMKDLELRGAGNILGKEQSGNVNAVGLNLYCQILSEAIEKLRHSHQ